MGGVDKHDRLVGQHTIPLTAKRGYIKIFFHVLDSAVVNAWILYKTVKQADGKWNSAAQKRHTLSWFKQSIVISLCGSYTSRKHSSSVQLVYPTTPPIQSIEMLLKHQIRPISEITENRCLICRPQRRTVCLTCKQPYCYECGIKDLTDLVEAHFTQPRTARKEDKYNHTKQLRIHKLITQIVIQVHLKQTCELIYVPDVYSNIDNR